MDADTIAFLLRGGHLSVSDRIARGLWPHPPIKLAEVFDQLVKLIESEQWFPREWRPAVQGEPVWEGGVIERRNSHAFIYRSQRHHPTNPRLLAETGERVFSTAEAASRFYLRWDLHLPGDLDGWKVIE